MLNPFINLISNIISLIDLLLMVWIILGLLMHFDIINRHHPLVERIYATLGRVLEPMLRLIRRFVTRYLPNMGGLDIAPIILILILHFINDALYSWFYNV